MMALKNRGGYSVNEKFWVQLLLISKIFMSEEEPCKVSIICRVKRKKAKEKDQMEAKFLSPKGKKSRGVFSDHNSGSGWKSPFKLMSPIVHTKTIYLHEWWLMRHEEGEGIAIGGLTSRREGFETCFNSAPIMERHDNTTLESSDGFIIYISGLINRSVSEQNGFPSEVCSRFINGFPCNWDDLTSQHFSEKSDLSFQDMPYLQRRDILLFARDAYNKDCSREPLSNDLVEKLKPAIASPDVSRDCDLPSASRSKKYQEMDKVNHSSLKLEGVRTRGQLRSLGVKNGKLKESEIVNEIQDKAKK